MASYGSLPSNSSGSREARAYHPHDGLEHPPEGSKRERLGKLLESHKTHICLLMLITLDFLCVLTEIVWTVFNPDKEAEPWVHAFGIAAFVINCIFLGEVLLRLLVFGTSYYTAGQWWFLNQLDAAVVVTTFLFDVLLIGKAKEVAGLLIMLRFWRIVKVMSTLAAGVAHYDTDHDRKREERIKVLESELQRLNTVLREIASEDKWNERKRARVFESVDVVMDNGYYIQ